MEPHASVVFRRGVKKGVTATDDEEEYLSESHDEDPSGWVEEEPSLILPATKAFPEEGANPALALGKATRSKSNC